MFGLTSPHRARRTSMIRRAPGFTDITVGPVEPRARILPTLTATVARRASGARTLEWAQTGEADVLVRYTGDDCQPSTGLDWQSFDDSFARGAIERGDSGQPHHKRCDTRIASDGPVGLCV